jgi:hypothetical protein
MVLLPRWRWFDAIDIVGAVIMHTVNFTHYRTNHLAQDIFFIIGIPDRFCGEHERDW